MEERNLRTRETAGGTGKIHFVTIGLSGRQSSLPAIEISPHPVKTINEGFLNHHTFRKGGDAGTVEIKITNEAKAKGEEKANRNTRPLRIP